MGLFWFAILDYSQSFWGWRQNLQLGYHMTSMVKSWEINWCLIVFPCLCFVGSLQSCTVEHILLGNGATQSGLAFLQQIIDLKTIPHKHAHRQYNVDNCSLKVFFHRILGHVKLTIKNNHNTRNINPFSCLLGLLRVDILFYYSVFFIMESYTYYYKSKPTIFSPSFLWHTT